jgi:uncharacterized protein YktA (UPF0223 family)
MIITPPLDQPWTTEQIIQIRKLLDRAYDKLEKDYMRGQWDINNQYKTMQEKCPHKHIQGGQYMRWCEDCGMDCDTT